MGGRGKRLALVAIPALLAALVPAARAFSNTTDGATAAPGWAVTDFATGFNTFIPFGPGPIGLAFDSAGNLYSDSYYLGCIYKFPPAGGDFTTSQIGCLTDYVNPTGLAFSKDGRLFLAEQFTGNVVELDLATGAVKGTVASGMDHPTGLATDPQTGDLFVSAGQNVLQLHLRDYSSTSEVTPVVFSNVGVDGLTFAPDGTLYAAGNGTVYQISGAGSTTSAPGTAVPIASVPYADGIALMAPANGSQITQLAVNRNNGSITLVDFSVQPATETDIVTGGTRGDFAAVGPDKCLYATQSDEIEKVTAANGTCPFIPNSVAIPPSKMGVNGLAVDGFAGLPLAAPIATFTDTDLTATPVEFKASALWGDGQTTDVTVMTTTSTSPVACPPTTPPSRCFLVYGEHTYQSDGNFNVEVTVTKVNNQTASAFGTAHVTKSAAKGSAVNASMFGWTVGAQVSSVRGLMIYSSTLNEVRTGVRQLADDMSVPYLKLSAALTPAAVRITLSPAAVELTPDGSFIASSKIITGPDVSSIPGDASSGLPGILVIQAKYRIDLSPNPSGTTSWLEVTQQYQFHQEMADNTTGFPACEPSQNAFIHLAALNCARWKPILAFKFHPGTGDSLTSINAVERLHFLPDDQVVNATTLGYDCDGSQNASPAGDLCNAIPLLPLLALYQGQNPIQREVVVDAVKNNQPAGYDNLHLTSSPKVGLPSPPPGCPECVHIHWRWGQAAAGYDPAFGQGLPLFSACCIAPAPSYKSDQSLDVALVSNHVAEQAPQDFRGLVQGLPASGYGGGTEALVDPVVFLSSTATNEDSDAFFAFGGFFGSQV